MSMCGLALGYTQPSGPYFALGMSEGWQLGNGQTSHIDTSTGTINPDNDRPSNHFQGSLAGGYSWSFMQHWRFDVGLSLTKTHYDMSGTTHISPQDIDIDYDYRIRAIMLKPAVRLAYATANWSYFIGGRLGVSWLDSDNYRSQTSGISDDFASNQETEMLKGVEVGIARHLDASTDVSLGIRYEDLGEAELGPRQMPGSDKGMLKQELHPLSVALTVTHWFQ